MQGLSILDTRQELLDALARHRKLDGSPNIRAMAQDLGISRSTVRRHLDKMKLHVEEGLQFPDFPDDDISVEKIIDLQCDRINKRKASYEAHTWYPVKVPAGPLGVLWFGDPHVDDKGCNMPLLKEHIDICKKTPDMYGANIGDTTNNWSGRLIKLYANQETSVKTARKLAKWFMLDAGVEWLVWIFGNHDQWGDGSDILKLIGGHKIVMHDWEARFRLVWPDETEIRINAAHDFKGHSQWNPGHGPMKEAQMGEQADLYVCGHKHNWYTSSWETAQRGGGVANIARVRGYKYLDEYARNLGIREQDCGASCVTIFRPYASDASERVQIIYDVEYAARILKMERAWFNRRKA